MFSYHWAFGVLVYLILTFVHLRFAAPKYYYEDNDIWRNVFIPAIWLTIVGIVLGKDMLTIKQFGTLFIISSLVSILLAGSNTLLFYKGTAKSNYFFAVYEHGFLVLTLGLVLLQLLAGPKT